MFPRIEINLTKVVDNTRTLVQLCKERNIDVCGVTKAVCGDPNIARTMLRSGVTQIADSRISNIRRMRKAGIDAEMILLRAPSPGITDLVVEHADISLVSEIDTLGMLNESAAIRDTEHGVILMVDIGDRREGVAPNELHELVHLTQELDHLSLRGIGTNVACYGGIIPTVEKMKALSSIVEDIESTIQETLVCISGGNSANIPLILEQEDMDRINHLRIGEGILLGLETVGRTPIPGTHQDIFTIFAELVESKMKPSVPDGIIGQDAFGHVPQFKDRGMIHQGLLALGRQDIVAGSLTPVNPRIDILGVNSDYIVLDLGKGMNNIGEAMRFKPGYGSLLQAMTSPYVEKVYIE